MKRSLIPTCQIIIIIIIIIIYIIINNRNVWLFVNHFLLCYVATQIYAMYTFKNTKQLYLFNMSTIHNYIYSKPMSVCLQKGNPHFILKSYFFHLLIRIFRERHTHTILFVVVEIVVLLLHVVDHCILVNFISNIMYSFGL